MINIYPLDSARRKSVRTKLARFERLGAKRDLSLSTKRQAGPDLLRDIEPCQNIKNFQKCSFPIGNGNCL